MIDQIVAWLTAASLAWVPAVGEAKLELRRSMLRDIADVAYDGAEAPLFDGPRGRARTALLLGAVASFESQYREDVDDGRKRGNLGEVCILQVLLPSPRHRIVMRGDTYAYSTEEGWSYADLVGDRQKCVRAALRKMRESLRACHDLSLYTGGRCDHEEPKAKHRQWRAEGWWRKNPSPLSDDDVVLGRAARVE